MKPFIMLNKKVGTAAKNEFARTFKLRIISIFEKAMENIRNRKDVKLVVSLEKYAKYVMKQNFKDGIYFRKSCVLYSW